jgi:hypothetical protein
VRELESVPMAVWNGGRVDDTQLALALFPADAYPAAVVEHERAAREFLARYRAYLQAGAASSPAGVRSASR